MIFNELMTISVFDSVYDRKYCYLNLFYTNNLQYERYLAKTIT